MVSRLLTADVDLFSLLEVSQSSLAVMDQVLLERFVFTVSVDVFDSSSQLCSQVAFQQNELV